MLKKYGPRSELDEPTRQLASRVATTRTGYEIVDSGYINDVKEIIKLFFRNQSLLRISVHLGNLVGLLRRDCFIDDLNARLQAVLAGSFTLAKLQSAIREIGSAVLEFAEELRRPTGGEDVFVVPLAIYREVKGPIGVATSND